MLFFEDEPKTTNMKTSKMKLLFIVLAICFSLNSIAQKNWETKEQTYSGGVAMSGLIDVVQAKVIGLKPMGKNVVLKYDPFFDKYTIDWLEEDGPAKMVLKFSEQNSGGKMYVDTYSSNTAYFIHNYIERDNKLTVLSADPIMIENRKVKLIFVFDDLK
jgi:hypothetical protein